MNGQTSLGRFNQFEAMGQAGTRSDVDALMGVLDLCADLATTRLVDYALGLVRNREGIAQLRHYLFNGTRMQRNYAALYFKRRGWHDLLEEALVAGCIDFDQGFAS